MLNTLSINKTWVREARPQPGMMVDVLEYDGLALTNPYELILREDMQSAK